MSNRKIINAAATGGIGYYPVGNPTDAYYDNVSLLLNGDVEVDSNFANVSLLLDGNTLTDKSNNKAAITNTGSVTVSSAVKKFGTGSMAFSGSNYLTVPSNSVFSFGTGDFTVEAWVYRNAASGTYETIFGFDTSGQLLFQLYQNQLDFGIRLTGSNLSGVIVPINTWVHLAISRQSGVVNYFQNGVLIYTYTGAYATQNFTNSSQALVGCYSTAAGYWNGYIDDLRITKGVARYTSSFTPPVKAFPTHEILDSSVYRLPVTTYGNARIDTATKKFGTGAMYFDGTGDAITFSAGDTCAFGTGDFTIELHIKFLSVSTQQLIYDCRPLSTNGAYPALYIGAGGVLYYYVNTTNVITGSTLVANAWYYIAIVRTNGVTKLYVDSQQVGSSYTDTTNYLNGTSRPMIGSSGYYAAGADSPLYGFIDDLRITKGIARTITQPSASLPTIPPTIPADPWWGNVSLLLDGNTTDDYDPYRQNVSLMLTGDDFIDWSNQHGTVTTSGTTSISSSITKFRSGAIQLNGAGTTYLSIPSSTALNMTGDFTMEYWAYFTDLNTSPVVLSKWASGNYSYHVGCDITVGKGFFFIYSTTGGGGGVVFVYSGIAPVLTTWTHFAVSVSGTTLRMFVDGILVKTTTISSIYAGTEKLTIGNNGDPGYSTNAKMVLSDIRITKGVCRYTADFTKPTAALPSYKIQDRTQNNLTLTPYGNVQLSTDVMKNGTGSMFFDGSGDYVNVAGTSVLDIKTGDFTLEAWIYPTVSHTNYGRIFHFGPTWAANCYGFSFDSAGKVKFQAANLNVGNAMITSSSVITVNAWSHVAVTRSGSLFNLFVNGISQGTYTDAAALSSTANQPLYIGMDPNGSATYTGYINDARITQGYARYTQNFTPPSQSFATQYISTGYDANYADVSLLLNGNGTNGSTTFTDLSSTPKTITAYGNAQISTSVKKYGTGAMYFDGTGDVLKTPPVSAFTFGTGDFTVEGWFYQTADRIYPSALEINNHLGVGGILFITKYSGVACIYAADTGGGSFIAPQATTLNTWNHIAWVRNNGVLRTYVNGVSSSSAALTLNITATTSVTIGGEQSVTEGYCFPGYIDDLRITKGIARYTTNFTPPTYQLPTDTTGTVIDPLRSSTSLLLRGNGTNGSTSFTDESPNGLTVTNNGSVNVNTTIKKYGTGSIYFNGASALAIPTSNVNMGTGDFTVEAWAYYLDINGWRDIICFVGSPNWGITTYNGNLGAYNLGINLSGTSVPINTWFHVAVSRQSSTVRLFLNGNLITSANDSTNLTTTQINIGCWADTASENLNGYIDDLRITKGYARYTSNFTPPTYEDPIVTGTVYDYNYPQVSLLLNSDGTNGSTVFKDLSSSPKTITNNGSVSVNTSVKKFGTGSMAFSGGNYLSIPTSSAFSLGTNDFTIECWLYFTSNAANQTILALTDGLSGQNFTLFTPSAGTLSYYLSSNGSSWNIASGIGVGSISANQWYHFSLVRIGTTFMPFLNGTIGTTTTSSAAIYGTSNPVYIGASTYQLPTYVFTGYMDDLRITKGLARYTQNFTPPTAPLPTSYS